LGPPPGPARQPGVFRGGGVGGWGVLTAAATNKLLSR
jgi:hypothetical protein